MIKLHCLFELPPPQAIRWEKRLEMVGVPGIYNFYRHVEARAIDVDPDEDSDDDEADANKVRRGPLFVGHNRTVRRARRLGSFHAIRVVRWWESGVCGLQRRGYSGIGPFKKEMLEDMKEWLAPDVKNGVPARFLGIIE